MPDKPTDTEIKKALECCSSNVLYEQCVDCPYEKYLEKGHTCIIKATKNALDLINRLQAENKEWKTLVEVGELQYRKQKAEVEDLEKKLKRQIQRNRSVAKQAEAEAYKKFADNIERAFSQTESQMPNSEVIKQTVQICRNAIRLALKELVGEDNESKA